MFRNFGKRIGTDDVDEMVRIAIIEDPKLLSALLRRLVTIKEAKNTLSFLELSITAIKKQHKSFLPSTASRAVQEEERLLQEENKK